MFDMCVGSLTHEGVSPSLMSETPETKIGDLIKEAREARGWSQEALASKAGTTQQTLGRIENGRIQHSRALPDILQVLGLTPGKALALTAEPGDIIPAGLLVGDKGMPIYASTEGGDGAIVINFDPVDYVKWPAPLLHVKEGFGVIVSEESMFPAYEPGDIALVNPRVQPRRDQDCVLLSHEGGSKIRSLIKRFKGATPTIWRVSQWNPNEDFELAKSEWPRCWLVTGRYNSR